jgi:hypothetical protein
VLKLLSINGSAFSVLIGHRLSHGLGEVFQPVAEGIGYERFTLFLSNLVFSWVESVRLACLETGMSYYGRKTRTEEKTVLNSDVILTKVKQHPDTRHHDLHVGRIRPRSK